MRVSQRSVRVITFIMSYIVTRGIFKLTNFQYSFFREFFNIPKLIIDFGTWMITYVVIYTIIQKCFKVHK
ncbi:hypothetical protein [Clostridium brassicae]|uniref:Uncharacterized protein n=1 Tax=Clostridium brassicae TaxID=2999072 RepID=A0ABT4DC16_9CLOT|nr:hypothetical protein [Clostridium brassicae]MCY6959846.1 hypothetical protein [Clostridium brassicae]